MFELLLSFNIENKNVSAAKIVNINHSKLLIKIKNKSDTRTEPCGTLA